jgi:serine/threonine-protein kinase HipA
MAAATKETLAVCIGAQGVLVGEFIYVKDGSREYSSFSFGEEWLRSPNRFSVSPELELIAGHQVCKAPTKYDSCFFHALADTEPDAWGRRVIARAHARERKSNPALKALTELDYLCAVDDFSRVGALRLRDARGQYLRMVEEGKRSTPPLLELESIFTASRAVELGQESAEDLAYLQGKGTSLGGMRPKCTVLDEYGMLALGKFPSISDERSVTRGEVLAMRLAQRAGIDAAEARIMSVHGTPVAIIQRFDRTAGDARIPYVSAASMLQTNRNDEHAYTEVVDIMRRVCANAKEDVRQLWRRLVFNHLITNIDDHLQNLGFLYVGKGFWRLAPAFDLNPFPDKDRESKTWLSEETGPVTSIATLLETADYFYLDKSQAIAILTEVHAAIRGWRQMAVIDEVGLTARDLQDFAPAFEHEEMETVRSILA